MEQLMQSQELQERVRGGWGRRERGGEEGEGWGEGGEEGRRGWGREGRTGPQQSPEPDGDAELVEAGHLPSGGAGKGGEPSLGEATEAKPGRGRDRGVK